MNVTPSAGWSRSIPYLIIGSCLLGTALPAAAQRRVGERPVRVEEVARPRPGAVTCDEVAVLDREGRPVFPAGATDIEASVVVAENRGSLANLYAGVNTTTDAFYANLPCEPSIGGTLPQIPQPTADDLGAATFLADFEGSGVQKILEGMRANAVGLDPLDGFTVGPCTLASPATGGRPRVVPCNDPGFLHADQPFEGRDIIYVHGLGLGHLMDRINHPGNSGSTSNHPSNSLWPADAPEFLSANGYFRNYARQYWSDHIRENLFDPNAMSNPNAGWQFTSGDAAPRYNPKNNRYLLVAWSSNQTLEYAQHAMLNQIMRAMIDNTNVVTPPRYPSKTEVRPFCANGCIIISHSAGGLVTNTTMARARAGDFGRGGEVIVGQMAAHVAFASALSGSRLATLGMAVAVGGSPVASGANLICAVADWLYSTNNSCNADLTFVATSILRDLIPAVAQTYWGPFVNASPIPTVTITGGTPLGNQVSGATKIMLPGLDDGVVTSNSSCGNSNAVFPHVVAPSGAMVASLVKAFDFSENGGVLARGVKIFLGQKNLLVGLPYPGASPGPAYLASACTPYLSPTGMVMPIANALGGTPLDARKRYNNHFSFIQSLGEHSYDGGGDPANSWPSTTSSPAATLRAYWPFGAPNVEESVAVTDGAIYTRTIDTNGTRLVKSVPSYEIVKGRKVSFKLFGKRRTWWIWKRTYHLAEKSDVKQSTHYAYEFVGRR